MEYLLCARNSAHSSLWIVSFNSLYQPVKWVRPLQWAQSQAMDHNWCQFCSLITQLSLKRGGYVTPVLSKRSVARDSREKNYSLGKRGEMQHFPLTPFFPLLSWIWMMAGVRQLFCQHFGQDIVELLHQNMELATCSVLVMWQKWILSNLRHCSEIFHYWQLNVLLIDTRIFPNLCFKCKIKSQIFIGLNWPSPS